MAIKIGGRVIIAKNNTYTLGRVKRVAVYSHTSIVHLLVEADDHPGKTYAYDPKNVWDIESLTVN